jgi:hypothetical protein
MRTDTQLLRIGGVRMKALFIALATVTALGVIAVLQLSRQMESAPRSGTPPGGALAVSLADADVGAGSAADRERARFIARMQDRFDALSHDMRQLASRMDAVGAESREEAQRRMRAIESEADKAREGLQRAAVGSSGTWSDIKARLSADADQLGDDLRKAHAWVSEKTSS